MTLPRRTAVRRRLLIALLALVLLGGLRWNAMRLNETERTLVGVWEVSHDSAPPTGAVLLLADRREYRAQVRIGGWMCFSEPIGHWAASPGKLTMRRQYGVAGSITEWWTYAKFLLSAANRTDIPIRRLTDDEIELQSESSVETYRRSQNPELLRMFKRLNTGESL